jgi:hypothetical protein
MAELRIPIIVENKGKKAFGEAGKSVNALDKSVKRLGGTLAGVFGAQQLLRFAKNASKAFMEDEKAATRLAQSVKNLGLAFETPRIESFISELSMASGVADDLLRPSMQRLLQTTGSVTKSQELLTQALDISRGSGVAYETVVNDLSMAYVGQTRGLRKYSLGLSQAELKTMSFADVQEKLTKQFSGSSAAYLTTYSGKMELLSTAAGEATETIGKGLVDALSLLAGEGNTVQPLADGMADFATNTSNAIVGIAVLIDKMKKIPGIDSKPGGTLKDAAARILVGPLIVLKPYLDKLIKMGADAQAAMSPVTQGYLGSMPVGIYDTPAQVSARKKAEADAAKRAKELAALQKKNLDAQKKANALTKASKTLDLERIGATAALKGKLSETDRLSLQLQLALLDKNDALATKLSAELEAAVKRQNALAAALLATPKAPNPYADWKIPEMNGTISGGAGGSGTVGGGTVVVPKTDGSSTDITEALATLARIAQGTQVDVFLDGEYVGQAVSDVQLNKSLSGSFNQVNRSARFANTSV